MNDNKRKNAPYTQEEKDKIFELYNLGYNSKQIGDELGKTKNIFIKTQLSI